MAQKIDAFTIDAFIQDGLFNVVEAEKIYTELKKQGKYDWKNPIAGVDPNYLHRMEALTYNLNRSGLGRRQLDEWFILGIVSPTLSRRVLVSAEVLAYTVRHLHLKTELSCATLREAKNEWRCCTCNEPVPPGVLWVAKTQKIWRSK